jgi:hypothetical protein
MPQSTPPPSVPEDGKLEALGEKTHQVESEKKMQTAESNDVSTVGFSTANSVEKQELFEDDRPATKQQPADEPPPIAYPKGVEVLFIMLALILSITLVSLDQVSSTSPIAAQSRLSPMHLHTPVN